MTGAEIRALLREQFGEAVVSDSEGRDMDSLVVDRKVVRDISRFLRDDSRTKMEQLTDITAVDWSGRQTPRFELVVHYYSFTHKHRIRLKFPIPEADPVYDSLSELWACADWLEREVYDMFGLKANGHPNLRRILTHDDFEGHPLRKEYPVNRRQGIRPPVTDLLTLRPYPGPGADVKN